MKTKTIKQVYTTCTRTLRAPKTSSTTNAIKTSQKKIETTPQKHKRSCFISINNWFKTKKYKIQRAVFVKPMYEYTLSLGEKEFTQYIAKNFNKIKTQLLSSKIEKSFIEKIQKCKTPEEVTQIIKEIKLAETLKITDIRNQVLFDTSLSLNKKQEIIQNADKEYFSKLFNLEKALSIKSTDKRVLDIEEVLRNKYGMEFVSLKNDYAQAKNLLEACELMAKKGEPIPQNYIVSNMMAGTGQALRTESCVLHATTSLNKILNPPNAKAKNLLSVENKLHTIIHEFGHCKQGNAIELIEIPKHFKKVPKTVSKYAKISGNAELWAELYAKVHLAPQEVIKEQWELFRYMESQILKTNKLNTFT